MSPQAYVSGSPDVRGEALHAVCFALVLSCVCVYRQVEHQSPADEARALAARNENPYKVINYEDDFSEKDTFHSQVVTDTSAPSSGETTTDEQTP